MSPPARSVAPDFLAPGPGGGWCLTGRRCTACTEVLFGRQDRFCPACGAESLTDVEFGGRGAVWSYTVLRNPPPGPRRADDPELPCPLALVELDDAALRVSVPLAVPVERVRIGLPVQLDPRPLYVDDDGAQVVGIRFREVDR
ncbi:MAG TPA: OB-fold domain-containing protein [Pseudonocardia sp.]|nr:OB-fold domain-containing protein [Pseudonocardia sp.]